MSDGGHRPEGGSKYSITRKLNIRLFGRLFWIYFSVNVLLLLISGIAFAVYCENKAAGVVRVIPQTDAAVMEHGGFGDISVREIDSETLSRYVTPPLSRALPSETRDAARGLRVSGDWFRDAVKTAVYVMQVRIDDKAYEIAFNVGGALWVYTCAFMVFLAFELFWILKRSFSDRRMVRRTLAPITEFARTTKTLQSTSMKPEKEKMDALAGRLAGIDAAGLHKRIPVEEAQTELRPLAIAINQMLDRISESYEAQARFVSDASHELRTPISVIQGYANLLDRWGKNDEKTLQESITAIKDEAASMKELVEQLLFLARGDNNTIVLQKEPVDLSEIAEEVVSEMQMLDSFHKFELVPGPARLDADRGLVKQALRILVDNAMKYTDEDGRVTISTEAVDGFAKITVQDTGIGISPETIPHIFDRFVRDDASRTRATGGAGLGLSIASWIADRHGGHMDVLSRVGLGTRISIVLPAPDGVTGTSAIELGGANQNL